MNINPVNYRFCRSLSAASNKQSHQPSFKGNKNCKGPSLPHDLEPETKFTKKQAVRSQCMGLLFLSTLGIAHNELYKNNIESKFEVVTPECSSFNTREEALEYAKKRITDALKEPKPYEYNVLIDNNNNIVNEFKGDSAHVMYFYKNFDRLKNLLTDYSITSVHGHPDQVGNITTPISFGDFTALVASPIEKESIVFNKNGEYSLLRKTDKFVPLDDEEIEKLNDIYSTMMSTLFEKNHPEQSLNRQLNRNFSKSESARKNADKNYLQNLNNFQTCIDGIKAIDVFWRELAPRLGLEYETNYSYLK